MIVRVTLTKEEVEKLVIRHVKEEMGLDDRPKLQMISDIASVEVSITDK